MRKQRRKVGNCFSKWKRTTSSVLQDSILEPLLFKIFVNYIFLFTENSTQHVGSKTCFSCAKTFPKDREWFYHNLLVSNPKKCHFMTLCNVVCDDIIIKNTLSDKSLGLTIDNNFDFSDRISNICKITNQKLNILFRLSASMNWEQCNLLINSFINSHFKGVRLFGCSIVEKAWKKSLKSKNLCYEYW